jgi:hypothetical protein
MAAEMSGFEYGDLATPKKRVAPLLCDGNLFG